MHLKLDLRYVCEVPCRCINNYCSYTSQGDLGEKGEKGAEGTKGEVGDTVGHNDTLASFGKEHSIKRVNNPSVWHRKLNSVIYCALLSLSVQYIVVK